MNRVKLTFFALLLVALFLPVAASAETPPLRIGWIGAITGPAAKYGAFNGARLAQEQINARGGVTGRKLELVFEDGKCDGKTAVTAAKKLIDIDRVSFIIGGHCTPESAAIVSFSRQGKVLMLAAITSSPKLSGASPYFFRVTPLSTAQAELTAPYAFDKLGLRSFAVIHEETDYARPPAERFAAIIKERGGEVVELSNFLPGETDFRALIARLKQAAPQVLYIGAQSPDAAAILLRQISELGLGAKLFGNEVTGNAAATLGSTADGLIFGDIEFNLNNPRSREFIESYKSAYHVDSVAYLPQVSESFDAVNLMAKTIAECGESIEQVRECLSQLHAYHGAAGEISIDKNHDGLRRWELRTISNGKIAELGG